MQENAKNPKTDKKRNIEIVLYLLNKCLKMKVHKILECQMNVYAPTFI